MINYKLTKKQVSKMNSEEFIKWQIYQNKWDEAIRNEYSFALKTNLINACELLDKTKILFSSDYKTIKQLIRIINEKFKYIDSIQDKK